MCYVSRASKLSLTCWREEASCNPTRIVSVWQFSLWNILRLRDFGSQQPSYKNAKMQEQTVGPFGSWPLWHNHPSILPINSMFKWVWKLIQSKTQILWNNERCIHLALHPVPLPTLFKFPHGQCLAQLANAWSKINDSFQTPGEGVGWDGKEIAIGVLRLKQWICIEWP